MEFSTLTTAAQQNIETAALAVGVFTNGILTPAAQAVDHASGGAVRQTLETEFRAKPNTRLVLRNLPGVNAGRIVLIGLGEQASYSARGHAAAELAFARYCVSAGLTEAVSALAAAECPASTAARRAQAAAVAAGEATYHYSLTLGKKDPDAAPRLAKLTLAVSRDQATAATAGLARGRAIANGMALTRQLGDLPANICTPTYLGEAARKLGREFRRITVEVLERQQIEALKMGSFLSVARGSYEPPVFIVLKYAPASRKPSAKRRGAPATNKAPIVLVGKGITFDAGGISLKPAAAMDEMKYDMCGAASVLGTLRAVAELELDREVIGLVPSCENLPSGRANKPGDVVTSMSGQTIEILNTDAEGRLILCDTLTYAERFKPAAVIDMATLTGACVVALGHVNSGLFSPDDALAENLLQAGRDANDPAWRLPLDGAYQERLRSNFADTANVGGRPAGAITAACFLSRFTKAYRWAHLDIAGTAWRSGGADKGATGRPVPLLVQYLADHA
ncbi:MAG: leucyl aminopeptidase [Candidimonas sp.]|nr:MAG: leucyl aminopeptidase [Candidimonas sp.]